MNLKANIIEAYDASRVWLQDVSTYGGAYIDWAEVDYVNITFLYTDGNSNYADNYSADATIKFMGSVDIPVAATGLSQTQWACEILPSEVVAAWGEFPEGIYYIKYKVVPVAGYTGTLPDNNDTYIFGECLFSQTQQYHDELLLKVAQDNAYAQEENYLFWYTTMFHTKFEGLKAACRIGNLTQIRTSLLTLQTLRTKYPESNDTRRYTQI